VTDEVLREIEVLKEGRMEMEGRKGGDERSRAGGDEVEEGGGWRSEVLRWTVEGGAIVHASAVELRGGGGGRVTGRVRVLLSEYTHDERVGDGGVGGRGKRERKRSSYESGSETGEGELVSI
jgi:hypothetical protein